MWDTIDGVRETPVQWPAGWPRTPDDQRRSAPAAGEWATYKRRALSALEGLACASVISRDPRGGSPAVAVYWLDEAGVLRAAACDTYTKPAANLARIASTLEAYATLERRLPPERTAALRGAFWAWAWDGQAAPPPPPPADPPPKARVTRGWRAVLGLAPGPVTRMDVERAFRLRARQAHPDAGGSHEEFLALQAARERALAEVG